MPESYVQLASDAALTGKKMRTRQMTYGANTVEEHRFCIGAEPTYYVQTAVVSPNQNVIYLAFLNNAGSNQVLKLRRLFLQNSQLTAVATSGQSVVGMIEWQVKAITSATTPTGTAATVGVSDSVDGTLTNYTAVSTAANVTEGNTLWSWYSNNDEIGADGSFPQALYQQSISQSIDGWELKEIEMNPGEGFCLKQITAITGRGQFNVFAVITREL